MTSLARDRSCRDARLLGAYVDGELDAPTLLDIETHLTTCELCRERVALDKAMRGTLKRVVRGDGDESASFDASGVSSGRVATKSPNLEALRARAKAAMLAERARSDARSFDGQERGRLLGWRTMVPIASAAALALFWGGVRGPLSDAGSGQMRAGFADDLLADLVAEHSSHVPVQWTTAKDVRALDQYVGVPVRPASFERSGARLIGGRVLPVRQQHAAMLEYVIGSGPGQRRLSVFVYDPHKIQISGAGLAPHPVGTAQVQVGSQNGYSVALTQHGGVGYAVASEDPDRSAQYAALAYDSLPDE
jgi:anti-sigma factor RsiW